MGSGFSKYLNYRHLKCSICQGDFESLIKSMCWTCYHRNYYLSKKRSISVSQINNNSEQFIEINENLPPENAIEIVKTIGGGSIDGFFQVVSQTPEMPRYSEKITSENQRMVFKTSQLTCKRS